MPRNAHIILRTEPETKRRLLEAAQKKGLTLSSFILDAAGKAAREAERRDTKKPVQGGVPTFFRASCIEAQRGGSQGYSSAGYNLAHNLADLQPYDLEDHEWQQRLDELRALLQTQTRDDEKILAWFTRCCPRCMNLIPRRRHDQFLQGVYDAFDTEQISLDL